MPWAICGSAMPCSVPAARSDGDAARSSWQGRERRFEDLKQGTIAIPGRLTTAYLLLRLFDPATENVVVMTFDRIMEAVARR